MISFLPRWFPYVNLRTVVAFLLDKEGEERLEMGETGDECAHCITDKWYEVEYAENVLANILSRLPVKSLLACKSVCKHWCQLISSQAFIDLQLLWSKNHSIYIVYPYMDMMMTLYLMKDGDEITKRITFPYCDNLSPLAIICSFDGLLCCINYTWKVDSGMIVEDVTDLEIRICNPVTRKALLLPKGSASEEKPSIGVAFGPQINEYKIFRFFCAKRISLAKRQSRANRRQCEVYSSSTGSWSVIGRVPYCPMQSSHSPLGSNHVFVNGKIYWFIASDEDHMTPGSILTVDIDENFGTIELPKEVTEHSYLVDLEGCLSLVAVYDEDEIVNIWILEDKDKPKWELKCSDPVPFSNDECVEFVVARENEIFFITSNHYYIYELDQRFWRELDLNDTSEKKFPVAVAYTESLLSCDGRMDPQTEDISNKRSI
ncbi:F-box family protein-related, putative isoform 2 [Theobroma cacao]|uniref:F-box family protein-related, putative isoform 2 n=2 Tax=Theobroma cacao TaxID=3641 RepID=A0A061F787_THECC|nr:F-box family protein-related, putative isoform 2 [Theobroma cacao]